MEEKTLKRQDDLNSKTILQNTLILWVQKVLKREDDMKKKTRQKKKTTFRILLWEVLVLGLGQKSMLVLWGVVVPADAEADKGY